MTLKRLLRKIHRAAKYGKKWTPVHQRALRIKLWSEFYAGKGGWYDT